MTADVLERLSELDREALMERMAQELPEILGSLGISRDILADKTGVDVSKIKAAEAGRRIFKWSEFMSILFVIWNNDIGRGMLEKKGLFPAVLKEAMSINRNAHAPVTEASKYGL